MNYKIFKNLSNYLFRCLETSFQRIFVVFFVTTGFLATVSCTDDKDACKVFCDEAAKCLECGGPTADLDRCYDVCINLTIEEKKSLSNCATDCVNMRSCWAFTTYPDLNPCR